MIVTGLFALVGATLALAQIRRAEGPSEVPAKVQRSERISSLQAALSQVSTYVTEDDRLELAGVREMSVDGDGRTLVRGATGGDFGRDAVLSLPIRVEVDSSGALSVEGIHAARVLGDSVLLVLEAAPGNGAWGGVAADPSCQMAMKYPENTPYCKGACTVHAPNCAFAFDGDGDIICKCIGLEE